MVMKTSRLTASALLGSSVGGETADVERRNQQLHILVGIFVIKILKRNHLLGLDGEIRAK